LPAVLVLRGVRPFNARFAWPLAFAVRFAARVVFFAILDFLSRINSVFTPLPLHTVMPGRHA